MPINLDYVVMNLKRNMLSWIQILFRADFPRRSEFIYRIRVVLDKFFANRKLAAGVLITLIVLLYFGPSWFYGRKAFKKGSSYSCLLEYASKNLDATGQSIVEAYLNGDEYDAKKFAPYVGNGYFGLNVDDRRLSSLYITHDNTVSIPVPVDLQVNVEAKFAYSHESSATVLSIHKGVVFKIAAFEVMGECAFISSSIYAHRTKPELLMQEIQIDNPTLSNLNVDIKDLLMQDKLVPMVKELQDFTIKSIKVIMQNSVDHYRLTIGRKNIPSQYSVKPNSQERITIPTFINISQLFKSEEASKGQDVSAADEVLKLRNSLKNETHLMSMHTSAWTEVWKRGFSISHSKAPNTLNSGIINATTYYLLCNTKAPLTDTSLLYNQGQCFNFHNTLLYPSRLWSALKTTKDVLDITYRWKLTLDKRGCSSLVKAGGQGLQQAVMLSLGGFKYTKQHLEFDVDPSELHRDYYFAGIAYKPGVWLDVWIEVGSDNKPQIFLAANNTSGKKLYACDAGCLDEAQEIKDQRISLPVKLTDPLTPILYVTDDQKHMQELQHSIHVKEVVEAPPHEHHVIAMHKHGHRLGGLPTIFWVALIVLLVGFHLFLFKLIFNEYCRDDSSKTNYAPLNRMRYRV